MVSISKREYKALLAGEICSACDQNNGLLGVWSKQPSLNRTDNARFTSNKKQFQLDEKLERRNFTKTLYITR